MKQITNGLNEVQRLYKRYHTIRKKKKMTNFTKSMRIMLTRVKRSLGSVIKKNQKLYIRLRNPAKKAYDNLDSDQTGYMSPEKWHHYPEHIEGGSLIND